jgi:hypothetical protein
MEIAVVTARTGKDYGDLRPEAAMVKSSLLYGEHVALISGKIPALYIQVGDQLRRMDEFIDYASKRELAGEDVAAALREEIERREGALPAPVDRMLTEGTASDYLRALASTWESEILPRVRESSENQHRRILLRSLEMTVATYARRQNIDDAPLRIAAQELKAATEAGFLDLELLVTHQAYETDAQKVLVETLLRLLDVIEAIAVSPGSVFPLFDPRASEWASTLAEFEGTADPPTALLSPAAKAGHALVASLEAFPMASMDVVLDVRERLKPAVVRFRAALADAASGLQDAGEADFIPALEELRVRKVAPAVLDIEESLDDLGARPTLLRGWPPAATGVIALSAAVAFQAPELTQLAAVTAGLSTAFVNELTVRAKAARERRKNSFFLLHEADRFLKEGIEDAARQGR